MGLEISFRAGIDQFRDGLGLGIEVRLYSDDIVTDFLQWTHLQLEHERAPKLNRGVGLHTACILAEMNRLYPAFDEAGVYLRDRARSWMVECVMQDL